MSIDEQLEINSYYGSYKPLSGWYSRNFNKIEKTNTVVYNGIFEGKKRIAVKGAIK